MTSCTSVSRPTHIDGSPKRLEWSARRKPPFERLGDQQEESNLNSLAKLSDALRSGMNEDRKHNLRLQTNCGNEGNSSKVF